MRQAIVYDREVRLPPDVAVGDTVELVRGKSPGGRADGSRTLTEDGLRVAEVSR